MKKSILPKIAFLAAAMAVGSVGIATDALARGGLGGGVHSLGAGALGNAGDAPSVSPIPFAPNSPLGRDFEGLNFNSQLRNGATGGQPGTNMSIQPQPGMMNERPGMNANGLPGMNPMP